MRAQDYLATITHARKAGGDLANCAAYLAKLDAAIEEFEKIPTTPTLGNNADFSFAAGITSFVAITLSGGAITLPRCTLLTTRCNAIRENRRIGIIAR